MRFAKMNGLGNDYIFIDGTKRIPELSPENIVKLCDRHYGIGGDGIIIVTESDSADYKMIIYNSDGTEAEMCGNALRCLAKFVHLNEMTHNLYLKIETKAGFRFVAIDSSGKVTANMGKPSSDFLISTVTIGKNAICGYRVNVGNPHFVVLTESLDNEFENYAESISGLTDAFPNKTNVEFVCPNTKENSVFVRVYERGSGETLACGTGATAVFETGCRLGILKDGAEIILKGGSLHCRHNSIGEVLVAGDTELNFNGNVNMSSL